VWLRPEPIKEKWGDANSQIKQGEKSSHRGRGPQGRAGRKLKKKIQEKISPRSSERKKKKPARRRASRGEVKASLPQVTTQWRVPAQAP